MKKLYVLFVIITTNLYAQPEYSQKKIDSLLVVLQIQNENASKIDVYQQICESYGAYFPKKMMFFNNKILELSKKLKFEKGIGFYYFNHIFLFDENQPQKTIMYAKKASLLFKKTNTLKYYIDSQCFIADRCYSLNKKVEARKVIVQTLPIALTNSYNFETAYLYTALGRMSHDDGLLRDALKYYKAALKYHHKDKSSLENMYLLYFNISLIYTDLKKYNQALKYLNIANKDRLDPSFNIETGRNYYLLGKFDKALEYYLRNTKLKMSEPEYIVNTSYIAQTYFELKKEALAIEYAKSILHLKMNSGIKINTLNTLSRSYLNLHNIKKAKEYNEKASYLVNCSKIQESKLEYYFCKTAIEEADGNYKEALYSQKAYSALQEENFNTINKDKITELQLDFEVAEKDNNIKNLKLAQLKKTIQINKQASYITYGLIFIAFIIIGLLLFLRVFNIIKKKNKLIGISNTELENTQVQLEKSLHTKETLLKEIHHRVKNNLQLVMSLLYIQSREKETNIKDFLEISQSRILAMALIHENLYQTEDLSRVDFKEYVNSLTQSIVTSFNNLHQDIQLKIELQDIYLDIQTAIPLGLIINELISNAYKHAFVNHKKGVIILQLVQKEANFELTIRDNGVGIKQNVTTKKSLGLELVSQLVNQISGVLQIQNNAGMQYSIQFQNITV